MIVVLPTVSLLNVLTAQIAAMLTNPHVHLYKAVSSPLSPATALGDFTEADYTGYVVKTAAFNPSFVNPDGNAETDSPLLFYQPTGTTVGNVVLGFYITDNADAVLLWAGQFDSPVNMNSPLDGLPLVLQFDLAPPA